MVSAILLRQAPPTLDKLVINLSDKDPTFTLQGNLYVSSHDLAAALKAKQRLVLIDVCSLPFSNTPKSKALSRSRTTALPGEVTAALPKDVMIIAYCSCPSAAAEFVVGELRDGGFDDTAVLYEGIFGWMNLWLSVVRQAVADSGR